RQAVPLAMHQAHPVGLAVEALAVTLGGEQKGTKEVGGIDVGRLPAEEAGGDQGVGIVVAGAEELAGGGDQLYRITAGRFSFHPGDLITEDPWVPGPEPSIVPRAQDQTVHLQGGESNRALMML